MRRGSVIDSLEYLSTEDARELANQALQSVATEHAIAAIIQSLDETDRQELAAWLEELESGEKTEAEVLGILLG